MPRELHRFILERIELALGRRSWRWLSDETGIPQSTLATQRSKPKFSVDVLIAIANALDRPVTYFLPEAEHLEIGPAVDALEQIQRIIESARDSET